MSGATARLRTNPFPGLRPFREGEEYLFFGRENQVDAMVDKLADTHFLAVVGTSGSGKSSLVNCGLRPALRQGLMARAAVAWRMGKFQPGADPIRAMARALAKDGVLFREPAAAGLSPAEIIETTLRMSRMGLIDIFEQARLGEGVNLLVVVDQFEELFRYPQLDAAARGGVQRINEEAATFVNLLLEVKRQKACAIFVVLTMRSDFLGDCAQFPGLAEAINAGLYLVPRMTRDERRAAIEGPVRVAGAEITPVLLTQLVNDVGDNPDQLSILQHALNRTWARWQDDGRDKEPLDLPHYEAIGAMAHALDQHAEQAYADLGAWRRQEICEKLFKALTDKATDPRGVRRPTKLRDLCALADATKAEVTDVIDVFRDPSRSFLMPPAAEALGGETVIDISHESLMRVWRRLDTWADEEARSVRTYRRLTETAALHVEGQADLLRDPELQLALNWRDNNHPNETWAKRYHTGFAAAMDFLTRSREAREAANRRDVLLRRSLMLVSAVAVITACIALWAFLGANDQALRAHDQATAALTAAAAVYVAEVNDLFPQSAQIITSLKKKNIRIAATFGSSSIVNRTVPDKFVVAIGPEFLINIFQEVFKICLENGLDGLKIVSDPRDYRAIYIGSFAYEPYTPITKQLKDSLLAPDLTWPKLKQLVNTAPVVASVQINDLFPQSAQIITGLKKKNIQIDATFGSNSIGSRTVPDKFVIAIGPEFPIDAFQEVFKTCLENGLDGLKIVSDPRDYGAIYIGSFAYEPYTPITEQLKSSLFSPDLTWPKLKQLVNADSRG